MLRWMKVALLVMALSVILVPSGGTQTLDDARPTAAVPLEFLKWIEQSEDWLRAEITAQGLTGAYEIKDGRLESEDVGVLRAVNRIRAFARLNARGLRPPYVDLTLRAADGSTFRCVTPFPKSIVPAISAKDFKAADFPATGAEPMILDLCRVDVARLAEFAGLERRVLRERYFDNDGELKTEFMEINGNPALLATMIEQGFFVYQSDFSGRTRVEP